MSEAQYSLDISAETCPLTFVKTKLLLENMAAGEVACIRLGEGEPLENLPRTLRDQATSVLNFGPRRPGRAVYRLLVRKGPGEAGRGLRASRGPMRRCEAATGRNAW